MSDRNVDLNIIGRRNEWKGNNKYNKSGQISDSNVDQNIMERRNEWKGNNKQVKYVQISDSNVDKNLMRKTGVKSINLDSTAI